MVGPDNWTVCYPLCWVFCLEASGAADVSRGLTVAPHETTADPTGQPLDPFVEKLEQRTSACWCMLSLLSSPNSLTKMRNAWLSQVVGLVGLIATTSCAGGVPPPVFVPTIAKSADESISRLPDKDRGYWDDPLYVRQAWECAHQMDVERERMKNANGLAIAAGVATLTSALVSGILAAQSTSTREDNASLGLLRRPEFYGATFAFVGGLTATSSPFLFGTTDASRRHQRRYEQWSSAERAVNLFDAINHSSEFTPSDKDEYRVVFRYYMAAVMAACVSPDGGTPIPLPTKLQRVQEQILAVDE